MTAPVAVVILDEGSVVARTLELLLQGVGYRVCVAAEVPPAEDARGLPGGIRVLLLAPGSGRKLRAAALSAAKDNPRIPVLELVTTLRPVHDRRVHRVLWPCRTEDLKQKIEGALLAGDYSGQSTA